ncbi:MAG: hypothetical protein HYT94_01210 [Parcubacteria group bacterium]|nr:hypothetical protein [Parcubacteria group bacterium]
MNTKKKLVLYSFLGTVGTIVVMWLLDKFCENIQICYSSVSLPDWSYELVTGEIFLLPLSLFIVSLILIALREEIFQSWKKFAKIYLVISTATILYAAFFETGNGGYFLDDTESITIFLSAIFLIVSIAIIAIKSWKLRGK